MDKWGNLHHHPSGDVDVGTPKTGGWVTRYTYRAGEDGDNLMTFKIPGVVDVAAKTSCSLVGWTRNRRGWLAYKYWDR